MALDSPKRLLSAAGLSPKHSFGQNFLSDVHACERIARLAAGRDQPTVVELGAGLGALTDRLLELGCKVVAVERDRDLVPVLRRTFAGPIEQQRMSIEEADAKEVDWLALAREFNDERPPVIAGNLPYQITGPLVERAVSRARHIARAVFLVQKEVADRLSAKPGSKQYGAWTVFVQAQFRVERAFVIRSGAFYPPPRVDSAVLVLHPLATPVCEETPLFRSLVKAAFHSRRKTLKNAWKGLAAAPTLEAAAQECGISLEARGETLAVSDFAAMARALAPEGEAAQ